MRQYDINSPYYAINLTYPDKFKSWEFKKVPINFWNDETRIEALKWLNEKFKCNKIDTK